MSTKLDKINKTVIVLITSSLFFISCIDRTKVNNTAKSRTAEKTESYTAGDDWLQKIQLNEGTKWEANPETNDGVDNMKSILTQNNPKKLKEYHEVSDALNNEKNIVVEECTMKGSSHDNLHIWLLPLIEKIDALKEAKTLGEAELIHKSIEQSLNAYNNYFK